MPTGLEMLEDPGWPFLRQRDDISLQEQAARKFDNKTHTWVSDPKEGYVIGEIAVVEGDVLTVKMADGRSLKLNKDETQEINPAKYEKTEDMSNLTFLNEASVLHNLRQRYHSMMIYTYSGLFCVFINPYKWIPIYTDSIASMYIGRRRSEMPPHLFAVADEAFRNMVQDHANQSMLITGESGAGKTENTKKVISYFAKIGGKQPTTGNKKEKAEPSLEDQVVQANPAIEAFGNSTTNRNYNSSRYGKFIRIHFDAKAKLVGGDIEHYLLEKSRVIKQAPGERSYHIFYQIMTNEMLKKAFLLEDDIRKYHFVSQAEISVPVIDDTEEMRVTDEAFDVMGFSADEKIGLYKLCAAIMHMGEMKFKPRPREEQAEIEDMTAANLTAKVFGVDEERLVAALLHPRVKVGNEWVSRGQTVQQVDWAVGGLAKANYARMFAWLIERCNVTLKQNIEQSASWIGVLDIAGFEIFDTNSFEQLWINFVNERLQQFFNHHMFILEQEEYQREGIEWTFVDFGLDLQACIELIEKPLGIVSMLDEECIVPKATDMTYVDKLNSQHLGKHPNYQKAKPPKGKQTAAHFAIVHYAGTVRYNADCWLDKNKDPLNDSAVAVLKTSINFNLLLAIWEEYKTDYDREEDAARGKVTGKKKGKAASFLTVSTMYRESLNNLMNMLHQTHPHFIRCIIPNEKKTSGLVDASLVMNQLTCNGVLEGIRICRKGFPNRMLYADFRYRYAILAADEASSSGDAPTASKKMLEKLKKTKKLTAENFRIGETKVFFKAGVLARMEEMRDEAISAMIAKFQAAIRHHLALSEMIQLRKRHEAIEIVQANVRAWSRLRNWAWFRLYGAVKPMLQGMRSNAEVEALEKKVKELEEASKVGEQTIKAGEQEREQLRAELAKLAEARKSQEANNQALKHQLTAASERFAELEKNKENLQDEISRLRRSKEEEEKILQAQLRELTEARQLDQSEASSLKAELARLEDAKAKLTQQKKSQELANQEMLDRLEQLQIKFDRAEEQRQKAIDNLDDTMDKLAAEKRAKDEAAKGRKKLEAELKTLRDQVEMNKKEKKLIDEDSRKYESDIGALKQRGHEDANLICKLQNHIRQLMARIEELEEQVENEVRARNRAERQRCDAQAELDVLSERVTEANGQLSAQIHLNKNRQHELSQLHRELEKRNISHETHIADLCSMQWLTLHNLRNLTHQAQSLENEAGRVLNMRQGQKEANKIVEEQQHIE